MIYQNYLRDKNQNAIKLSNSEGAPCILKYSKGKNLKNYEIYGNSYQATRSGKNLFDKSISTDINVKNETVITSRTYALKVLETNVICEILKPDTTYTLSCEFECTEIPSDRTYSHGILGFLIHTTVEEYSDISITIDKQMLVGEIYKFSKTFTTPSNFNTSGNYNFYMYRNKYTGDSTIGASMICRNIQIEEGTSSTEYEQYGVMPSPEFPSEIQSVGDLTKNLFDIDAFLALNDNSTYYSKNENGELVQLKPDYRSDTSLFNYVTLSAGNYIISYSNTEVTKCQTYVNGVSKGNTKNFTLTETSTVGFKFYESAGTVLGNIQIEEGSTATEYEPYHKYDIPIMVRGKNLLPYPYIYTTTTINGVTFTDNGDGSITIDGTATANAVFYLVGKQDNYTLDKCGLKIGDRYTISKNLVSGDSIANIYFTANYYNTSDSMKQGALATSTNTATSTIQSDFKVWGIYLLVLKDKTVNNTTIKPQIEKGSSATEYEPYKGRITEHIYLDEPLRKVGDYADYIDFKNQRVARNIKEITLNGSENWRLQGINENGIISFLYTLSTESTTSTTNVSALSSHYSYKIVSLSNAIEQGFFIQRGPGATNIYIRMLNEEIADITAFKTLLSENNVTVYYQMATPIEENIPLPALKTFKGTSIISVDTSIQPSNIKTKYVKL